MQLNIDEVENEMMHALVHSKTEIQKLCKLKCSIYNRITKFQLVISFPPNLFNLGLVEINGVQPFLQIVYAKEHNFLS